MGEYKLEKYEYTKELLVDLNRFVWDNIADFTVRQIRTINNMYIEMVNLGELDDIDNRIDEIMEKIRVEFNVGRGNI